MTHLQDTTPADPAQGVSEAERLIAMITPGNFHHQRDVGDVYGWCERLRADLTAAIGAGGQAVASKYADAVYIASKTKHAARWRKIASVDPVSSSWIYEAGEGESADLHDLWYRCLLEAATSKALVAYREEGEVFKGGWVEIGAALANGVPVHAVGLTEFTIAKYRGITHHATMKEAMTAALKEPRHVALIHPADERVVEALREMRSLFDEKGYLFCSGDYQIEVIARVDTILSTKEGR